MVIINILRLSGFYLRAFIFMSSLTSIKHPQEYVMNEIKTKRFAYKILSDYLDKLE